MIELEDISEYYEDNSPKDLGPYLDENFKYPEELIAKVIRLPSDPKRVVIVFNNGIKIVLCNFLIDSINHDYSDRAPLTLSMNEDYYDSGDTNTTPLSRDRIFYYLRKVGSM